MKRRTLLFGSVVAWLLPLAGGVYACGGDDDAKGGGASSGGADATIDGAGPSDGSTADVFFKDGSTFDGGACVRAPVVTAAEPSFVGPGGPSLVTITGENFEQTPTVYLRAANGTQTKLVDVSMRSHATLTARVAPTAFPAAGAYDVVVLNPDGCLAAANGFKVLTAKPPSVTHVSPDVVSTAADATVTVKGCNFSASSTQVVTVSSAGANVTHAGAVSCAGAPSCGDGSAECTWTGTLKTSGMTAGGHVLRVVDGTTGGYGEYGPFGVTTADGALFGSFAPAPPLRTARRFAGFTTGRVDDRSRFVYAIGGEAGDGAPIASVDVGTIDRFGRLQGFFEQKTVLGVPRAAVAAARAGAFLFAIGGTTSTQGTSAIPTGIPSAVVERARILDPAASPRITELKVTPGVGAFPGGTFLYRVSARGLPEGESLPSEAAVIVLAANDSVEIHWTPVPGATGYTVYRTPTPLDLAGAERRIVTLIDAPTTSFVDPGNTSFIKTEYMIRQGSPGQWATQGSLVSARIGARAVVAADPTGATFLYVIGGWGTCPSAGAAGPMDCYEYAPVDLATGSLGAFKTGAQRLLRPRFRAGADVVSAANAPGVPSALSAVVVAGGMDQTTSPNTVELATVTVGGELGPFLAATGFDAERDGTAAVVAGGYLYAFGGGRRSNPLDGTLTSYTTTPMRSGPIGAALQLSAWANAGAAFPFGVAQHGAVTDSAFVYLLGGTTTDDNALDGVYSIVY